MLLPSQESLERLRLPLLQLLSDGQPRSLEGCAVHVSLMLPDEERESLHHDGWLHHYASLGLVEQVGDLWQLTAAGKQEIDESLRLLGEMHEWMEASLNALGEN